MPRGGLGAQALAQARVAAWAQELAIRRLLHRVRVGALAPAAQRGLRAWAWAWAWAQARALARALSLVAAVARGPKRLFHQARMRSQVLTPPRVA